MKFYLDTESYNVQSLVNSMIRDFVENSRFNRCRIVKGFPIFASSYNLSRILMTPMMVPTYYNTEFIVSYMNNRKNLLSDDQIQVHFMNNKPYNLAVKGYHPLRLWSPNVHYNYTIKLGYHSDFGKKKPLLYTKFLHDQFLCQ